MKPEKAILLEELRKITTNVPEKNYKEDLEAVNKWIDKLFKKTNNQYLRQYLTETQFLLNDKKIILPFFYYQACYIVNKEEI